MLLTGISGGGSSTIIIAGSQGTSGYDSQFTIAEDTFVGEDAQAMLAMMYANCDDIDFETMDTDHNYTITYGEFQAWYDATQPW